MQCIICKGKKVIVINEQSEICENCGGSGEIITQAEAFGNDCPNGSCS